MVARAEDITQLARDLQSENLSLRVLAIKKLTDLGPAAAPAVPALIAAMKDPKNTVSTRSLIVIAFTKIGPAAKPALPTLMWAISATHPPECHVFECVGHDIRREVIRAIGDFGPEAAEAVPMLLSIIKDDKRERFLDQPILETLGKIGAGDVEKVVPFLAAYVEEFPPHRGGIEYATKALEELGPAAKPAVPILLRYFERNKDNFNGAAVAEALYKIDPANPDVLKSLFSALANPSPTAEVALRVLKNTDQFPAETVEPLRRALDGGQYQVFEAIVRKFPLMQSGREMLAPALIAFVKNENSNSDGRLLATLESLEQSKISSPEFIDALCSKLDNMDGSIGSKVGQILIGIKNNDVQRVLECCSSDYARGQILLHRSDRESKIIPLIKARRFPEAEQMIDEGEDVNLTDNAGTPALLWAVSSGQSSLVRKLAEHKVNIHSFGNGRKSALHLATEGSDPTLVALLIELGADRSLKDCSNRTPAELAADLGKTNMIAALRSDGDETLLKRAKLFEAAASGDAAFISGLAKNDPSIHSRDAEGYTPLMIAARQSGATVVKLLLEKGADPNAKAKDGYQAISIAINGKNFEIVSVLLTYKAEIGTFRDWPLNHLAASTGDLRILEALLDNGATIQALRSDKKSLIGTALEHEHYDVVEFLQKRGLTPNKFDLEYPFIVEVGRAGQNNATDLWRVTRLLELGADPNQYDSSGWTPLHRAVASGSVPLVRELLKFGGDLKKLVSGSGDYGVTPYELVGRMNALSEAQKTVMREFISSVSK